MKASVTTMLLLASTAALGEPCSDVSRSLTGKERAELAPAISQQLGVKAVDILQQFRSNGWNIVYVNTHQADESFLFYRGNPSTQHYVTAWSGAAASFEKAEIEAWVYKNAPGVPASLAECFAWQVTNDRDL